MSSGSAANNDFGPVDVQQLGNMLLAYSQRALADIGIHGEPVDVAEQQQQQQQQQQQASGEDGAEQQQEQQPQNNEEHTTTSSSASSLFDTTNEDDDDDDDEERNSNKYELVDRDALMWLCNVEDVLSVGGGAPNVYVTPTPLRVEATDDGDRIMVSSSSPNTWPCVLHLGTVQSVTFSDVRVDHYKKGPVITTLMVMEIGHSRMLRYTFGTRMTASAKTTTMQRILGSQKDGLSWAAREKRTLAMLSTGTIVDHHPVLHEQTVFSTAGIVPRVSAEYVPHSFDPSGILSSSLGGNANQRVPVPVPAAAAAAASPAAAASAAAAAGAAGSIPANSFAAALQAAMQNYARNGSSSNLAQQQHQQPVFGMGMMLNTEPVRQQQQQQQPQQQSALESRVMSTLQQLLPQITQMAVQNYPFSQNNQ